MHTYTYTYIIYIYVYIYICIYIYIWSHTPAAPSGMHWNMFTSSVSPHHSLDRFIAWNTILSIHSCRWKKSRGHNLAPELNFILHSFFVETLSTSSNLRKQDRHWSSTKKQKTLFLGECLVWTQKIFCFSWLFCFELEKTRKTLSFICFFAYYICI